MAISGVVEVGLVFELSFDVSPHSSQQLLNASSAKRCWITAPVESIEPELVRKLLALFDGESLGCSEE